MLSEVSDELADATVPEVSVHLVQPFCFGEKAMVLCAVLRIVQVLFVRSPCTQHRR